MSNDNTEMDTTGCAGCGGCGQGECGGDPAEPTQWCTPEKIELTGEIALSEPCPEPDKELLEVCTCYTGKKCPIHLKLELTYTKQGCDDHPCIVSIPPDLGCVPISAGVGKWDGGVPAWMNACLKGCDLDVWMAKNPGESPFKMSNGQSLLDLNTNPEHTTNLQVISDFVPRQINTREFFALSVKMYETGLQVSKGVNPNALSLNYVTAQDGSMMLGMVADGLVVGTGIHLIEVKDANGVVIGMMMPPPA